MRDIPTERDGILIEPSMLCDDHTAMTDEWGFPALNVMMATTGRAVESERFFRIAFRLKNGYAPPEGAGGRRDDDGEAGPDIPEGEQPGVVHINDTLQEVQPVCCWIVEHMENPYPEEEVPAYIAHIIDYADREMHDGGGDGDGDGEGEGGGRGEGPDGSPEAY